MFSIVNSLIIKTKGYAYNTDINILITQFGVNLNSTLFKFSVN